MPNHHRRARGELAQGMLLDNLPAASRAPAFSEIIRDGENGFLTSLTAEDLRAVFDSIGTMKEDGELVRIIGAARKTANLCRWEDINEKTLSHLDSVLKNV
jgi:glycosyltransferase involved in cell wall biosynthesis